jgi:hypothetical protein
MKVNGKRSVFNREIAKREKWNGEDAVLRLGD